MNQVDRAVSCFEQGHNCSQSLLSTYGPQLGLDHDTALRVSGAFGGGMGRLGETCGAVTGAFMVIGLKHGPTQAGDEQAKIKMYDQVKEFVDEFRSRHGGIKCKELLGYDISIPEERELARERGLFATLCPRFVRDAAEIVEQMLK